MNHPAISAKPATQRARRYRERKKTGARCLQIELAGDDIDAFVRIGVLAAERRDDSEAIKEMNISDQRAAVVSRVMRRRCRDMLTA
jgi:hypothetical protein